MNYKMITSRLCSLLLLFAIVSHGKFLVYKWMNEVHFGKIYFWALDAKLKTIPYFSRFKTKQNIFKIIMVLKYKAESACLYFKSVFMLYGCCFLFPEMNIYVRI